MIKNSNSTSWGTESFFDTRNEDHTSTFNTLVQKALVAVDNAICDGKLLCEVETNTIMGRPKKLEQFQMLAEILVKHNHDITSNHVKTTWFFNGAVKYGDVEYGCGNRLKVPSLISTEHAINVFTGAGFPDTAEVQELAQFINDYKAPQVVHSQRLLTSYDM